MSLLYPIFLTLHGKKCLIMGMGQTGLRKLEGLLPCEPASILVLDIRPKEELAVEVQKLFLPPVHYECRTWHEKDLDNCFLAFACSNDRNENLKLAHACMRRNIPCNCVSTPDAGTFFLGARASSGKLQVAISSSGASPLLAATMKKELETWLEKKAILARFMGILRRELLNVSKNSRKNRQFFIRLLQSPVPEWLNGGKLNCCMDWLRENMAELSASQIDDMLDKLENELS